jgi:hypothetical protein
VLARVDLLAGWIQQQIATHGGGGQVGDPGDDDPDPAITPAPCERAARR